MANVEAVTQENFAQEVLQSDRTVLVDFWAGWCGYCVKLAPVLEEIAGEMNEKLKIVKVDTDENRALAQMYKIMSLPTMVVFKDGSEAERWVGYLPKNNLVSKLTKFV